MIKPFALEDTRTFIKNKLLNLFGVFYIATALFLTFTLVSYSRDNPSLNTAVSSNFVNDLFPIFVLSDICQQFFGISAYLLPIYFLFGGINLLRNKIITKPFKRLLYLFISAILTTFLSAYSSFESTVIGKFLAGLTNHLPVFRFSNLCIIGALSILIFACLVYSFEIDLMSLCHTVKERITSNFQPLTGNTLTEEITDTRKNFKKRLLSPLQNNQKQLRKRQLNNSNNIYMLPPLELLKEGNLQDVKPSKAYYAEQSAILLKTLNDFGITGNITGVSSGPVVSLFLFEPSAGIKASRIISLASDIARSISATSVRVSIVPGRNVIGIEVPNEKRSTVYLREILSAKEFEKFPAPLAIALGKSIEGEPIIVDLAQMPHLLVAGTTGSGKSVAINTMILSLLYRLSPDACKLILVDPKMLELSMYEGIPHLLTPVVTEPKKAVSTLKWAVREMERRYQTMSKIGVRNIYGYNEKISLAINKAQPIYRELQVGFNDDGKPIIEKEYIENELFPHIVIVVDEMADLMMVAGKDIEGAVQRLAQMARAAGIHLIMATQRPSVDVITGTIKANFPTRISFRVSSKIDSRTILGEQGAEHLLGMGDMLYMANATSITRIHGPFVSDSEIEEVVKYLQTQGTPKYVDNITEEGFDADGDGDVIQDNDPCYKEAVELMRREGKISTSFIQRHLKIGYNRAARIVDQMECNGVISKPDHVGRRRIIG